MSPLTAQEKIPLAVDAWKLTVQVQQHFNDLQLRIRNFAVTFIGAVLGLAGLALKEDPQSYLAAWLNGIGFLAVLAFWFMDRHWYHRYLQASVRHGSDVETFLNEATGTLVFGLTKEITLGSAIVVDSDAAEGEPWPTRCLRWVGRRMGVKEIRSRHRIDAFYGLVAAIMILCAFGFGWHALRKRAAVPQVAAAAAAAAMPRLTVVNDSAASKVQESAVPAAHLEGKAEGTAAIVAKVAAEVAPKPDSKSTIRKKPKRNANLRSSPVQAMCADQRPCCAPACPCPDAGNRGRTEAPAPAP
jgi:hypothetical protein